MRHLSLITIALAATLSEQFVQADMSAETGAFVHDLTAPFASGAPQAASDTAAFQRALDILRREKLLGEGRPVLPVRDRGQVLAKALAVGPRYPQFLPELAEVHDALLSNQRTRKATTIQTLYEKLGRKKPEGDALARLIAQASNAISPQPLPTERQVIDKPDYTVTVENQRQAGRTRIEVLDKNTTIGGPALTELSANAQTRPDKAGKELTVSGNPEVSAHTFNTANSSALGPKLSGMWKDQNGRSWEVSINGEAVTLTELGHKNKLRYTGQFSLGRIRAQHPITHPDDIDAALPSWVRQALTTMGIHFAVALTASHNAATLDGVWISQHVTYDPNFQVVEKVHDPYDTRLTLTRGGKTAYGAADTALP